MIRDGKENAGGNRERMEYAGKERQEKENAGREEDAKGNRNRFFLECSRAEKFPLSLVHFTTAMHCKIYCNG